MRYRRPGAHPGGRPNGKNRFIRPDCAEPGAGYAYTLTLGDAVNLQRNSRFPEKDFLGDLIAPLSSSETHFPIADYLRTRLFTEILALSGSGRFLETFHRTTIPPGARPVVKTSSRQIHGRYLSPLASIN